VVSAGFGQGTYDITDRLRLTAGIWYSDEKKDFDQNAFVALVPGLVFYRCAPSTATTLADVVPQFTPDSVKSDDTWRNWTPKLALDYDLAENALSMVPRLAATKPVQ
jgi:iron complex outermembrane receptor protein